MNLTAGTALSNGKYVLNTQLGKGVFNLTYRATNTQSNQTVIIRTLAEHLRQHSEFEAFKQHFLEIAERLKRCKNRHLVQVLDSFEDDGCPYLVMEYIPGQTLAEFIQTNVLTEAKAIDCIRQIGSALSALHKVGLLHRDVKPQTIIRRDNTDCFVLTEFDMTDKFSVGMMQTQANLCSVGYASLEHHSFEEKRTPATDIYGLAATLYCLLYKNPPLPAPVRQALQGQGSSHLFLPDSHQANPNISSALKQALWRGLEITAQKRPQTVDDWLSLLPKPKKTITAQPSLQECLVTQPQPDKKAPPQLKRIQKTVKPAAADSKTSPPSTPQNNQKPQRLPLDHVPTKLSHPVTSRSEGVGNQNPYKEESKGKSIGKSTGTHTRKIKPTGMGKVSGNASPTPVLINSQNIASTPLNFPVSEEALVQDSPVQLQQFYKKSLFPALLMTGAIAASVGLGFGFALRINAPKEPGSTIFHTEQSFPPRSNWPGSEHQL
ncbi:MAG TPA: serine/threonine-protein kinase [Coleofasciculaceae cyanobacterium]